MSEKYEEIKVKVYRYNPDSDDEGRFEEYVLEKLPGMRILGALKSINEQGHNVAFRYGCEEWECGACAIRANGKPVLACKSEIEDGMVLEPLPDLPVGRDLMVDRDARFDKQKELYVKPANITGAGLSYKAQEKMWTAITCMECGICLASCPVLHPTGDSYTYAGPEFMVQYFRSQVDTRFDKDSLKESAKDGIWECVACNKCVENCPQRIPILEQIRELRGMILEDEPNHVPDTLRTLNANLFRYHNAYGNPEAERTDWAAGLDVPNLNGGKKSILFFVGDEQCYVKRDQTVAKAMVEVFKKANIDFGTLGIDEVCAGDPALTSGELGLFEELAHINIENLKKVKYDRIVAISPHDYHVIKSEYPKYGGEFNVLHYTQFLEELIKEGKLQFSKSLDKTITYHDSCYLGRFEQVYDSPRVILTSIPGVKLVEMVQTRDQAECCGGGGGGNFIDIPAGERVGERRVKQAVETGADILAVACPWCLAIFEDAVKTAGYEDKIEVKQIVELVNEAL